MTKPVASHKPDTAELMNQQLHAVVNVIRTAQPEYCNALVLDIHH